MNELLERVEKLRLKAKELGMDVEKVAEDVGKLSAVGQSMKASEIPYMVKFKRKSRGLFVKVRPAGHLLNSTLVQENLASGKVFIVNIEAGSVFIIEGSEDVRRV